MDNAAYSYGFQIDNGIPIIPFYNNRDDAELLLLQEYLNMLKTVEDVREANREHFKVHIYKDCENLDDCYDKLFRLNDLK